MTNDEQDDKEDENPDDDDVQANDEHADDAAVEAVVDESDDEEVQPAGTPSPRAGRTRKARQLVVELTASAKMRNQAATQAKAASTSQPLGGRGQARSARGRSGGNKVATDSAARRAVSGVTGTPTPGPEPQAEADGMEGVTAEDNGASETLSTEEYIRQKLIEEAVRGEASSQ